MWVNISNILYLNRLRLWYLELNRVHYLAGCSKVPTPAGGTKNSNAETNTLNSNFGAEAECSHFIFILFLRFEPETFLRCSWWNCLMWYQVACRMLARLPLMPRTSQKDVAPTSSWWIWFYKTRHWIQRLTTRQKQMSKIKTFLTDSQPGYAPSMFLTFRLISASTFL